VNIALVTGILDRSEAVAMALKRAGFEAYAWEGRSTGPPEDPAAGTVQCYVQLPPAPDAWSATGAGPVLAAPIMHRLDILSSVAKLLASDAAIVLVVDAPDGDATRRRALQALAEATVLEQVGPGRRVAVVNSVDAAEVAAVAWRESGQSRAVSLADLAPGLGHADWRNEIMNLTSGAETTYFGWRRPDGTRRTAVLRRSVLSPVTGGDGGGHDLARAMLSDAIGASTFADLQAWDPGLTEDFFEEIIRPLPADEFELSIHAVATWLVRRSLSDGQAGLGLGTVPAGDGSGEDQAVA
jgi:hypothetical protein